MVPDLRIVFLVSLIITAILFRIRFGPGLAFSELVQTLAGTLFLGAVLLTVGTFFSLLFRVDPLPFIREAGYQMGLRQLVSYADAIPSNLEDNLAVANVMRVDTDGDGFREWVVFYEFDTRAETNPILGVIYDNDRGNPPVIFPYALRAPDRDYLSENPRETSLTLEDITVDQNGPDGEDLPEIVTQSKNELGIFRFRENSQIWDFPRDAPPRYETIGFFRGSGGVTLDLETYDVTVLDRDGFERSQLEVRSIYSLNPLTNTYWDQFYEPTELGVKLAAPTFSTVDFFGGPPDDILDTAFPEKIVLAFYTSTCSSENETLCHNATAGWQARDFLTGDALTEFDNGNANYFLLPNFNGTQALAVSHLRYYPRLETDRDLLATGGGRDVVTGEQAQENVVDISFVADNSPVQTARFGMRLVDGRWKIADRRPVNVPLEAPREVPGEPSP